MAVLDLDPSELTRDELKKIANAQWYEARNILLASFSQIGGLTETDPADAGLDLAVDDIFAVDDRLKRYNDTDGFYHA